MNNSSSNTDKNKDKIKNKKEMKHGESEKTESRLYKWEVKTANGFAKGTTLSLEDAIKMIKLVSNGENAHSRVITSKALE